MSEVASVIKNVASESAAHAKASLASVDPASAVIGAMSDEPSVQGLIAAMKDHGELLVNAVDALGNAVHMDNVAASAAAGSAEGRQHVDMAKLSSATEHLRKAAELGAVVSAVKTLSSDTALLDKLRAGFAEQGLTGGYDDVRGALKHVDVDHIGIVHKIDGVISGAVDTGADTEAMEHIKSELAAVSESLKADVTTLLAEIDLMLAHLGA